MILYDSWWKHLSRLFKLLINSMKSWRALSDIIILGDTWLITLGYKTVVVGELIRILLIGGMKKSIIRRLDGEHCSWRLIVGELDRLAVLGLSHGRGDLVISRCGHSIYRHIVWWCIGIHYCSSSSGCLNWIGIEMHIVLSCCLWVLIGIEVGFWFRQSLHVSLSIQHHFLGKTLNLEIL